MCLRPALIYVAISVCILGACSGGQTGALDEAGPVECETDSDCKPLWVDELMQAQPSLSSVLTDSECVLPSPGSGLRRAVCQCSLESERDGAVAPADSGEGENESGNGAPQRWVHSVAIGAGGYESCAEQSRGPECLFCNSNFSGCSLQDTSSCASTCREHESRLKASREKRYAVDVHLSRCSSQHTCELVVEIGGQCYTDSALDRPYDCALGDAAILCAAEPYYCDGSPPVACSGQECDAGTSSLAETSSNAFLASATAECRIGTALCQTAADCSAALGCTGGQCVFCTNDNACLDGELCRFGLCLPAASVQCDYQACAEDEYCVLDGAWGAEERGHAQLRAECRFAPR